jgi:hypothetical protein
MLHVILCIKHGLRCKLLSQLSVPPGNGLQNQSSGSVGKLDGEPIDIGRHYYNERRGVPRVSQCDRYHIVEPERLLIDPLHGSR